MGVIVFFGDFYNCGRSYDMSMRSSISVIVSYLLLVGTTCFSVFLNVPKKYPLLDVSCLYLSYVYLGLSTQINLLVDFWNPKTLVKPLNFVYWQLLLFVYFFVLMLAIFLVCIHTIRPC